MTRNPHHLLWWLPSNPGATFLANVGPEIDATYAVGRFRGDDFVQQMAGAGIEALGALGPCIALRMPGE